MSRRLFLVIATAWLIATGAGPVRAEQTRGIVAYDDVRIDLIAEGAGPLG